MSSIPHSPISDPASLAGRGCVGDRPSLVGDRETARGEIADLVRNHLRGVLHYLQLLGADHATAADMAQETFVILWRKGFAQRGRDLDRLLRRIARDHLVNERRRRARWDDRSELWADQVDEAWERGRVHAWDDDALAALRACRARLTGRAREAVRLFYDDGLGRNAAAKRMGLAPNGLKTLLQRVRAQLRECVRARLESGPQPNDAEPIDGETPDEETTDE